MPLTVANKHHGVPADGIPVYIGRPSVLGNPFVMRAKSDRDRVVRQYDEWLRGKIRDRDPVILAELTRILDLVKAGHHVNLVCFCSPLACHGDVVKKIIEEALARAA